MFDWIASLWKRKQYVTRADLLGAVMQASMEYAELKRQIDELKPKKRVVKKPVKKGKVK